MTSWLWVLAVLFHLCVFKNGINMDIIDMISSKETWELFLKYKTEHGHMTERELKSWQQYIEKAMYLPMAESIADGTFVLPTPIRKR